MHNLTPPRHISTLPLSRCVPYSFVLPASFCSTTKEPVVTPPRLRPRRRAPARSTSERAHRLRISWGVQYPDFLPSRYCLSAVSNVVTPLKLSSTMMFIVFSSLGFTMMRLTLMAFPSRLSVSTNVSLPKRSSETLLTP